jgi:hypothetical protein
MTKEKQTVKQTIARLKRAQMQVEKAGEDTYNVISLVTGAVLKRVVPESELLEYVKCMDYVKSVHGADIRGGFRYIKPAHI